MIYLIKKHSFGMLGFVVLIVAILAVGAYAWNFRELPISNDTGKWADFATYLSGTVGVAAVVATLIAFVITLRQQQKLLISQDEMLEEQREQLSVAKEQLRLTEKGNDVQQAYLNLKDVLPLLLQSFSRSLNEDVHPYESDVLGDFMIESYSSSNVFSCGSFYQHPSRVIVFLNKNPGCCDDLKNYVNRVFGQSGNLISFLMDQLSIDQKLFAFVDAQLSNKANVDGETYWFYVECFLAFLIGKGVNDTVHNAHRLLRVSKAVKYSQDERKLGFYELGKLFGAREQPANERTAVESDVFDIP